MAKAKKTTKTKKVASQKATTKAAPKKKVISETNLHKVLVLTFIGIVVLCVAFVCLAFLPKKQNDTTTSNGFDQLRYDIIVESHRYKYEGVKPEEIPIGGYSDDYYYTFINSELQEKYTIIYQDIWDVHNERGDIDIITISTEPVSAEELDKYIKKYGIADGLSSVKEYFDADVDEEYLIKGTKEYDEYMKKKEVE